MVTQINVVNEDQAGITEGNTQTINKLLNVDEVASDNPKLGLALRVSNALQTTLDINELITMFSQQISPALPHENIAYNNDLLAIAVIPPSTTGHTCKFRLLVNNDPLGEITLYRSWEFSKEETKIFEYTLCSLVYPLRNAILYHEALHAAHKDPLTGVNNRATLDETLQRESRLAKRYERPLSLIVIDIDHFKNVNDTLGHAAGDSIIRSTAECTATCIRSTDILFRYGGEEFVVILSNTNASGAMFLAERIRRAIEKTKTICCSGTEKKVTASLGVATLMAEETEAEFFTRADKALYKAKKDGRNRVRIAEFIEDTTS